MSEAAVIDPPAQKAPPVWEILQNQPVQQETATPVETPAETPVETPKEEVQESKREMLEKTDKPLSPKGQENFAKVRETLKQREAEIAERDAKIKAFQEAEAKRNAEFESTQTRMKELEEKLSKANPDEFTAKEKKLEEELNSLRGELKMVALERDPEFIARFETPKTHIYSTLQGLAAAAQVAPEEFQRAMKLGQEDKLVEIREALPLNLQYQWDAAHREIAQIDMQRDMALKNKEATYQEFTQKKQAEYQSQMSQKVQQQVAMARQIAMEPFEKIPALKDNQELMLQVRKNVEALAGGEGADQFSVERILRDQAAFVVNQHIMERQSSVIESHTAKIQELESKLKERDEFIQQRYGSLPNNEVKGSETKTSEKERPLWEQVREMTHGGRNDFV